VFDIFVLWIGFSRGFWRSSYCVFDIPALFLLGFSLVYLCCWLLFFFRLWNLMYTDFQVLINNIHELRMKGTCL
jgi:hypothetical protein